jgi:putative ABC transport system ATP-binding protein
VLTRENVGGIGAGKTMGEMTANGESNANASARLDKVSKIYQTAAARITALEDMTWSVHAGEAVALMGPSGCGKTTILNLLGGMDRPSGGNIWVDGENVAQMTERQLEQYRLHKVGFVFQFFNLIPSLSAMENLELPMLMAGAASAERRARAEALLETVGLKEKGFKRPEELSGGEQQRVAVCLALVNDPPIILADEPTGNLDQETGNGIIDLLFSLRETAGTTLLLVTHDPDLARRCGRIVEIRDGTIRGVHH